jgi:hypothetical protein
MIGCVAITDPENPRVHRQNFVVHKKDRGDKVAFHPGSYIHRIAFVDLNPQRNTGGNRNLLCGGIETDAGNYRNQEK